MLKRAMILAMGCGTLAIGCAHEEEGSGPVALAPADDTQEIVSNLVEAGFRADDVQVVDGRVYAGRDAHVTLPASREMLQAPAGPEQYRTTNLVSSSVSLICVVGKAFKGVFSTGLDLAIENYNQQNLSFHMERRTNGDKAGCSATITGVIKGPTGGQSGFPSGGLPYPHFQIGKGTGSYGADVVEHVITHELGHAIGFRHSDFFNRSISCGTGGNEGDAGIGAIHIEGTPTGATVGGSVMNSCFRASESGEWTSSDVTALQALY